MGTRKPDKKYNAFAFTVRPRDGISDKRIAAYNEYCDKQVGSYTCTEKLGKEKHLHGQVFFAQGVTRGYFVKALVRIFERTGEFDTRECSVLRAGVRIAYDNNFIESYLQKEGDDTVVYNTNVPENTEGFYPTKEEQDAVKSQGVDPVMSDMEERFKAAGYSCECDNDFDERIKTFLNWYWFKERVRFAPGRKCDRKEIGIKLKLWITHGEGEDIW